MIGRVIWYDEHAELGLVLGRDGNEYCFDISTMCESWIDRKSKAWIEQRKADIKSGKFYMFLDAFDGTRCYERARKYFKDSYKYIRDKRMFITFEPENNTACKVRPCITSKARAKEIGTWR